VLLFEDQAALKIVQDLGSIFVELEKVEMKL
jgi:hypothetical protein